MVSKGNSPGQKLEGEQKRREKTEEERSRRGGTKAGKTEPAMTFGVAEEATIASAGNNRACSDGRCRKDEYGGNKRVGARYRGSSKMGPLCDGSGS